MQKTKCQRCAELEETIRIAMGGCEALAIMNPMARSELKAIEDTLRIGLPHTRLAFANQPVCLSEEIEIKAIADA